MASFTIPITYDKVLLVTKNPGKNNKLSVQVAKVSAPFTFELWLLLIAIIMFTALLSVWYSSHIGSARNQSFREMSLRRKKLYARLVVDSILQKGSFFFSAGVEHDADASLPTKLLMFGFGFLILITVSAYVANLAAFLTRNIVDVMSVEGVVAAGLPICAPPAIQHELKMAWPKANLHYINGGFNGMIDDYDLGRCKVLAVSVEDTSMDLPLLEKFCERDLVFTNSLFVDIPIAFPIRPKLASDVSYWMFEGERFHDLKLANIKDEYSKEYGEGCNVKISAEGNESSDDYAKITVKMMFFPISFFLGFALLSALLQIIHQRRIRNRQQTQMGAVSASQVSVVSEKSLVKKEKNATCLKEEDGKNRND